MSGPTPVVGAALVRRRIAGIAFLGVITLLVGLSVAMYQKAFTPVVKVTLQADRAGNQLSAQADVKLRGIVVGSVRDVHADAKGATIDLALDPDKVDIIPENVSAQLLPKTLFGEKYVSLVLPVSPAADHVRAGDVIPQDRSTTALETERVLNDLLPLLKTLRPQDLSTTLTALSTALRGRGDRLGATFSSAGTYFTKLNPSLPQLGSDMQGLADFADNLAAATPDLLTAIDNLSFSSRSVVDQRDELDAFLTSTTGFAATARSIVAENESKLIALARDSVAPLTLFARYAPEFPCFLKGLTVYDPIVSKTFGGQLPGLHITLEATEDNKGYVPGQEPKYRDTRGPACYRLPHPVVPEPDDKFDDGYRTETTPSTPVMTAPALAAIAAPALGVTADRVPDVVGLLLGPLAGGNVVGLA
ncbi:MAG: MCE family protein [Actinomycetota bacterium]|nr:MCE family protein [Actinomycetota bacterium]